MTIQPESINAQLYALGLSSNTDVHGFDSKLLCLSSDILTPIITKFANASLEKKKRVLNDWKLSRVTPRVRMMSMIKESIVQLVQ